MIDFGKQRVLVIAPHPDDEVFGCGGLISRVKREGGKVYVLYMTVGTTKDFSKKGVSTKDERIGEIEKVAEFLKLDGWRIAFPGNEYHLRLDRMPQKELIDEIERGVKISLETLKPTVVATPALFDYNQDHRATSEAVITATRPAPPDFKALQPMVFMYEPSYGSWASADSLPSPSLFAELSNKDLQAKITATKLYASQRKNKSGALSIHGVRTLANMRGMQCGVKLAEAFFLKRLLV